MEGPGSEHRVLTYLLAGWKLHRERKYGHFLKSVCVQILRKHTLCPDWVGSRATIPQVPVSHQSKFVSLSGPATGHLGNHRPSL